MWKTDLVRKPKFGLALSKEGAKASAQMALVRKRGMLSEEELQERAPGR